MRIGTRVLETLDNTREILSYDSIGCKQALPIFEELVKAEPVGEDYPATELEHRLAEWLERRAAAGHSAREASVSAHLPQREEEGERGEGGERAGAGEAGAGGNHFLAAKGRRAARGGFHEEQGRSRLPQQQPRSGSL